MSKKNWRISRSVKLTPAEAVMLRKLGGTPWVRAQLSLANELPRDLRKAVIRTSISLNSQENIHYLSKGGLSWLRKLLQEEIIWRTLQTQNTTSGSSFSDSSKHKNA